jgi:2-polyprenyl-3-methyl-5-hydroxy-6-metoxy-1,4-benzoquinol methylase
MKKRIYDPELLDLGPSFYTLAEYNDCLYQLGRIGTATGGDTATLRVLKKLPYSFDSILDVGCGGGTFTIKLAQEFTQAHVVGIDINGNAIEYAQAQLAPLRQNLPNVRFELRHKPDLSEEPKSFDIVTASLVCHHFTDEVLIDFLKRARTIARKGIVINDLHRHWLAYAGFSVIAPLFFRNRLIRSDSLLSIQRSFIYSDWVTYLQKAGFNEQDYSISWHWLFRWIVRVDI